MNSVNLIGNIGHDLELRQTNNGKSVLNFNIAVNEGQDRVNWFRITAWEKTAELINRYCGKGSKIGISGSLTTNKYTNNDGVEITSTEVIARMITFVDTSNNNQNQQQNNYNPQSNQPQRNNQQSNSNPFANAGFDDDPFASSDDVTDISNDDLPF